MFLYSTKNPDLKATFPEAVLQGIAPDGGLYMPADFPALPAGFFTSARQLSFPEIAFEVARTFLQGGIGDEELRVIISDAMQIDVPLIKLQPGMHALELFHGPTLAFKDFGARFLARTMAHLNRDSELEITVLVATSGDTGSAVAQGFYGVPGVKVCLLYPSGKVSKIQEQQLTTLGGNITAVEVAGTFDDCQRMVKEAFADPQLSRQQRLTSANSINIARLLPQMFYYFYAYSRLEDPRKPLVFSVPSGNFGNLTAGLFAWKMGLPVARFIAATNRNDVVPEYLAGGKYRPRPSLATISNAMDVGAPSNFDRMAALFGADPAAFRAILSGYSFTDDETMECMKQVYDQTGYILDPHGAVAFAGLRAYTGKSEGINGVFLETAHPAKFRDIVQDTLHTEVRIPERLAVCLEKEKRSIPIKNETEQLRQVLAAPAGKH